MQSKRGVHLLLLVIGFLSTLNVQALVIPDELPTLLSLIYSNIPTLKKGTDSRIGWGFRLGNRADFQTLIELGPQKDTQPLGNESDGAGATNKRAAAQTLANALYSQALRNKEEEQKQQQAQQQQQQQQHPSTVSDTDGGEFIKQWAHSFASTSTEAVVSAAPVHFTLGVGEVDAKDFIAAESDGKPQLSTPRTTTAWKDALDNVDLE